MKDIYCSGAFQVYNLNNLTSASYNPNVPVRYSSVLYANAGDETLAPGDPSNYPTIILWWGDTSPL